MKKTEFDDVRKFKIQQSCNKMRRLQHIDASVYL